MNAVHSWRSAPAAEFAVIGDPVGHSLSPKMHQAAYENLGLPYRYVAIHVFPGEVAQALGQLKELGYLGVNVTVPHKEEVLTWASDVEPMAMKARAANTVDLRNGKAINTDAPGFLDTLVGRVPPGCDVLMIGAGGSARSIAIALVGAGYRLRIQNRTHAKAKELAELAGAEVTDSLDPSGAALILNTTSASLQGAGLPIEWDRAESNALAYDLAYAPQSTPFMLAAQEVGLAAIDGRDLLAAQGARSFSWWLGIEAPLPAMREALD
jgi:shikimate dehydrogenase